MVPSQHIEDFIKGFETCKLEAYLPTPQDRWTCGWGATGPDIVEGTVWTQQQADDRFQKDMVRFGGGVWLLLRSATTQNQYDAMVSLAFNIGLEAFVHSTVLKMHNAGSYVMAQAAFALWNKQGGKVLSGLTRRRLNEAEIYAGSDSKGK